MEEASPIDYLQPLRRSWPLIAGVTLFTVTVALAISAVRSPTYAAQTILLAQDPNQALAVTGTSVRATNTAPDQAKQVAKTFLSDSVLRAVRDRQGSDRSLDSLRGDITVTPDPTSNLVTLEAQAGNAEDAARLANQAADLGAREQGANQRARYSAATGVLSRRLETLQSSGSSDAALARSYQAQIARLQTLSSIASPVEIAKRADAPSKPVSPKPLRDALIALVLGLFGGVILAYAREGLDRTIRDPREIEEHGGPPVIGQVSGRALGGVSLFPGERGALPAGDAEAIRILRANAEVLVGSDSSVVILVTSPMPKEGKSTIAAPLSEAFAAAGDRVLLVECDLRDPDLARRLGIEPEPGLSSVLAGTASADEILRAPAADDEPAVNGTGRGIRVVVPAGRPPANPVEMLQGVAFSELIERARREYDTVVLDASALLPVADALVLVPHADLSLLCVRVRRTKPDEARAGLAALARQGSARTAIVATGVGRRSEGMNGETVRTAPTAEQAKGPGAARRSPSFPR